MTSGPAELHRCAADRFGSLVHAVQPEQWRLPTPCAAWDLRALVNHVVGENRWAERLFAGQTVAEVGNVFDGDLLGDDPSGSWDESVSAAATAIHREGALDQTVHLSFGDVAGHEYVTQLVADLVIHSWDLARTIGQDETLDPQLVQACACWFSGVAELCRQAGVVGTRVDVPDTADPQTRLLADFGRDARGAASG